MWIDGCSASEATALRRHANLIIIIIIIIVGTGTTVPEWEQSRRWLFTDARSMYL